MGHEAEAQPLGEGGHLRHRLHLAAAATQYHHVCVVDHDPLGDAVQVAHRVREKDLAVETLEGGQDLEEQHPRVTKRSRGRLRFELPSADDHLMRGSVMLRLLAWRELVAACGHDGRLPDSFPATEGSQRLIGKCGSGGDQFFMDSHEVPFAVGQQLEDLLAEWSAFSARSMFGTTLEFVFSTWRTL